MNMMALRTVAAAALCITGASAVNNINPFAGRSYYVNPIYQAEINSSIATCSSPVACANLAVMRDVPSAFWIDTMAKISGNGTDSVEGILADAASRTPVPLVVFIVYDLPNRDCHASASNGEICCTTNPDGTCDYTAGGDCAAGIATYETQYITPLAALLAQYQHKVPLVLIIEPDSLPNLATNMGDARCGDSGTVAAYETGVPFAVTTLSQQVPNATIYVDAAHGGWLGWENNMKDFAGIVDKMGLSSMIRGFSTNVANYQPLGMPCQTFDWCLNNKHPNDPCCADPCDVLSQYNPSASETLYAQQLEVTFPGMFVVTDTGRNGVTNMRAQCADWCNIRGSGAGRIPTDATELPVIDAYFWLKPPGESDGCTKQMPNGAQCARFDTMCASEDSIGSRGGEPRAPVAGLWFDYMAQALAENANFNATVHA